MGNPPSGFSIRMSEVREDHHSPPLDLITPDGVVDQVAPVLKALFTDCQPTMGAAGSMVPPWCFCKIGRSLKVACVNPGHRPFQEK